MTHALLQLALAALLFTVVVLLLRGDVSPLLTGWEWIDTAVRAVLDVLNRSLDNPTGL